jgi:hypothetical protein
MNFLRVCLRLLRPSRIGAEALAGLSPYLNEHINRFGDCVLDFSGPPEPLPFVVPPRRRRAPQGSLFPVAPALAKSVA